MPPRGEMSGQDFNTVSFGTKQPQNRPASAGKAPGAPKAGGGGGGTQTASGISAAKLEAETDELAHAKVSKELKTGIMQARMAKGLTQKQLAQQLNCAPQVINEYESGKAIPNNAVIAKIERALCAKLPRAKK